MSKLVKEISMRTDFENCCQVVRVKTSFIERLKFLFKGYKYKFFIPDSTRQAISKSLSERYGL